MLENLNSYLDDPIDGNKQDDEVEIDLLEIFNVLKSKFLILLTARSAGWLSLRIIHEICNDSGIYLYIKHSGSVQGDNTYFSC